MPWLWDGPHYEMALSFGAWPDRCLTMSVCVILRHGSLPTAWYQATMRYNGMSFNRSFSPDVTAARHPVRGEGLLPCDTVVSRVFHTFDYWSYRKQTD
jgi:hypothetical protein